MRGVVVGEPFGDVVVTYGRVITAVTVVGEIDAVSVPGMHAAIGTAIDTTAVGVVVVDLSGVTFMGCHGVAALAEAQSWTIERQVRLCVVTGDRRAVLRPLRLTGLDQELATYDTLADVLLTVDSS